jgi:teichuronic acid biosynthesis glycosyltransferase TuaC
MRARSQADSNHPIPKAAADAIQLLTEDSDGTKQTRVLVVTRMWPTEQYGFRDGFVEVQVKALRRAGVACDVLVAQGRRGLSAYGQLAWVVRRLARSRKYDIIHAHYGLTAFAAGIQRLCPLVVTFHGSDLMGPTDRAARKAGRARMERLLSRAVARRANATIAVSASLAEHLPVSDVRVIPVGIDETVFQPCERNVARARLGLDPRRRYVLFAANPERAVKRFWLAQQAVAEVRRSLPDTELLVLHGQDLSAVPVWMNAADVLLITSAFEGGPLVHKEAMACNLPVVSVKVGDVKARLRGVQNSFVVADTKEALAAGLYKVLRSPERSDGRARIADLTATAVADRIATLYEDVLGAAPIEATAYTTKRRVA